MPNVDIEKLSKYPFTDRPRSVVQVCFECVFRPIT